MTRRRFFVPSNAIQDGIARLPQDESHHLRDVLRIGDGEAVEIFDGEGTGYTGTVGFSNSDVTVHNLKRISCPRSQLPLILATALIKPTKFEWMLQKATELGVHEIIPMKTRRCDIQIPQNRIEPRLQRWRRIVQEASKQCGRYYSPHIQQPRDYTDLLHFKDLEQCSKFLFYEKADTLWQPGMLVPGSEGVVLYVGPEGGWEEMEIEQADRAGVKVSGLGSWTLRAETAAVAAVSIVQHHITLIHSDGSICDE